VVTGDKAYEAAVASGIAPPRPADELLLGLFTDDDRGPNDALTWAVVFHGVDVALDGPPRSGPSFPTTVKQDLLVAVDATTGKVITAIGGVH